MQDSIAKEKKWGKKMSGNCDIQGPKFQSPK